MPFFVGPPPGPGATSDRMQSWHSARRCPSAVAIMTTVTRPSRRRPQAAIVLLRKRCRPGCRFAPWRSGSPRFQEGLPQGTGVNSVMLFQVDADDRTRRPDTRRPGGIPCVRRKPKVAAGQRYLRVPHAPRSLERHVPLDVDLRWFRGICTAPRPSRYGRCCRRRADGSLSGS